MPDGIRHEQLRKQGRFIAFPLSILLPPIIPNTWGLQESFLCGAGVFCGYEMGTYVTPDWDIMGTTKDEGRMVNELPILGHILFGISSMYGSIFRKHHRSFITHFPFVSTSIRHLLLFWWIYWQSYLFNLRLALPFFLGVFVGNSMADAIHWWADMVKYPKSE